MDTYLIFGVDMGNLKPGVRTPAATQIKFMNRALRRAQVSAEVADSFGSRGNFVLRTTLRSLKKARPVIEEVLGKKVSIFPLAEIAKHVERISATRIEMS